MSISAKIPNRVKTEVNLAVDGTAVNMPRNPKSDNYMCIV